MKMAAALKSDFHLLRPFVVKSSSGQHFPYLDGVRGLAVFMVLLFHSWQATGRPKYAWKFLGVKGDFSNLLAVCFAGVELFFILSGFLLAQSWLRADFLGRSRPSLQKYFRLRWFRIAPAYYCALVFWVLLFIPMISAPQLFYSGKGVLLFVIHALMLENLLPVAGQYNPTWWTMSVETLFYVLLPFGVYLFLRNRWVVSILVCLLVSLAWMMLCVHTPPFLADALLRFLHTCLGGVVPPETINASVFSILINQLPSYCFSFGLGITLANLYVRRELGVAQTKLGRALTNPSYGSLYFIGGSIIVLWSMNRYGHDLMRGKFVYLVSVGGVTSFGFTLVLAGLLFGATWTRALFNLVPLRLLGLIGYSAYLWHIPAIFIAASLPLIRNTPSGQRFPILFVHALFVTTLIASFFYLAVEKPFLIASRTRRAPPEHGCTKTDRNHADRHNDAHNPTNE
jgi:peptidoglycan/LPS O-acetylase OafA/YrhL